MAKDEAGLMDFRTMLVSATALAAFTYASCR